jgi:DNA-directed RNA polymerase specialized sigma subunit
MEKSEQGEPSRPNFVSMGRGGGESSGATAVLRGQGEASEELMGQMAAHERFLGLWKMRMNRNVTGDIDDLSDLLQARAKGLRDLTYSPKDQREMILAAREAGDLIASLEGKDDPESNRLRARAQRINGDARELFILCHRGFVERMISKHVQRLDSESPEMAREVLHQACDIALHRTIDRFDFDNPANPLTYATRVMQDEIKREAEAGRRVRLKSKANMLGDKIEQMAKEIENEGRQVSVAELAQRLDESPERIAEILPHARRQTVRLDAPVRVPGAQTTVGALVEDPQQAVEEPVVEEDTIERLNQAMNSLSPFERKVVEVAFGLGDSENVEQKDLFDGVYRDKKGRAFSAKASVIAERSKGGEKVAKLPQRQLNEMYKEGDLLFEPGNPESHALARAAKGLQEDDPGKTDRLLSYETGIPPTSGTVQETLKKGLEKLARHKSLEGLEVRYRGRDELENSESARERVRQRLVSNGIVDETELRKLQSTRSASGEKSKLRLLAEKHGLVDPDTGRLTI